MARTKAEGGISGLQKAAILLISLGPERSAGIFKHLKEEEIEELTLEIANTRSVTPQVKEEVINEILRSVSGTAVYCRGWYQLRKGTAGKGTGFRQGYGCHRQADCIFTGKALRVCA